MTRQLYDDERVRRILDAADIDILVACRPENFSYFSGVTRMMEHRFEREHTTFALMTRDAHPTLIVPYFEYETVREETSVTDIVPFRQFTGVSGDEATDRNQGGSHEADLASKISELGFQNSRIGYDEKYTPVSVYELIREHLPDAQLIAATDVFNRLRQVKTQEEINRLTRFKPNCGEGIQSDVGRGEGGGDRAAVGSCCLRSLLARRSPATGIHGLWGRR